MQSLGFADPSQSVKDMEDPWKLIQPYSLGDVKSNNENIIQSLHETEIKKKISVQIEERSLQNKFEKTDDTNQIILEEPLST